MGGGLLSEVWFAEHYWKILSLGEALGEELPELQELVHAAAQQGYDMDAILKRYPRPPDPVLWI